MNISLLTNLLISLSTIERSKKDELDLWGAFLRRGMSPWNKTTEDMRVELRPVMIAEAKERDRKAAHEAKERARKAAHAADRKRRRHAAKAKKAEQKRKEEEAAATSSSSTTQPTIIYNSYQTNIYIQGSGSVNVNA